MRKGNILFSRGFCTKGMGAINSICCGGVVDIYSLFHIRELYLLGKEAEESFLIEMAEDISIATQQILSWSGDTMGFCDSGMLAVSYTHLDCYRGNRLHHPAIHGIFRLHGYHYRQWENVWRHASGKFQTTVFFKKRGGILEKMAYYAWCLV